MRWEYQCVGYQVDLPEDLEGSDESQAQFLAGQMEFEVLGEKQQQHSIPRLVIGGFLSVTVGSDPMTSDSLANLNVGGFQHWFYSLEPVMHRQDLSLTWIPWTQG